MSALQQVVFAYRPPLVAEYAICGRSMALRTALERARAGMCILSRASGIMHHEECTFPHAHPCLVTDQLVVEPEGVSGLQAGILQRIFHTFEGDSGAGPARGKIEIMSCSSPLTV